MTVAAFYERHVVEGRAVLGHSHAQEPPTWISRAQAHGRISYWLCKRDDFEIERLDPERDVATIRSRAQRAPRTRYRFYGTSVPLQLTA